MNNNSLYNRYYNFNPKPYLTKNMLVKKSEAPAEGETGSLAVGVFTALGALPVQNASVIVYEILGSGEEYVYSQQVTDANGRVLDVELPVFYDQLNPLESPEYYFNTYNMRVMANNYYTVNLLNFRIFPGIKTNYTVDMIPVVAGETGTVPEQTFIVPPSHINR